jgi:hypothetical protein
MTTRGSAFAQGAEGEKEKCKKPIDPPGVPDMVLARSGNRAEREIEKRHGIEKNR